MNVVITLWAFFSFQCNLILTENPLFLWQALSVRKKKNLSCPLADDTENLHSADPVKTLSETNLIFMESKFSLDDFKPPAISAR